MSVHALERIIRRGLLALPLACALSPRLTWSPDGSRLAFRDDNGQGRVVAAEVCPGRVEPADEAAEVTEELVAGRRLRFRSLHPLRQRERPPARARRRA